MNYNVNPSDKRIGSDVFTLTSMRTGELVSLIPCDSAGNFNWTGITRAPLTRNAMKTTTSSSEYSDLEEPWLSIPDDDWVGGRGLKMFTEDKTRFFDSKRAQTAFKGIFNAPLDYYSDGYKESITNLPNDMDWEPLLNKSIAQSITAPINNSYGQVYIHIRKRGTPEHPLKVKITDKLVGGNVLIEHEYTTGEVTDTTAEFLKVTGNITFFENSTYYLTVSSFSTSDNNKNCWQVGVHSGKGDVCYEAKGDNPYTVANYYLYYRISDEQDNNIRVRYFTYEQQLFAIRQAVDNSFTPQIWINGDIGVFSSVSGNLFTDNTKDWEPNKYKGALLGITYQHGIDNQTSCWRTIKENTSTEIILEEEYDGYKPQTNSFYIITNTSHWNLLDNATLTDYVTDVLVVRGRVYICQGDYQNVIQMSIGKDGEFTFAELTGITATYLAAVRDSDGIMLWRANNDDDLHNRSIQRALLTDVLDDDVVLVEDTDTTITSGGDPLFTEIYDFGHGDFDGQCYEVTIMTMTSQKNTGKLTIVMQGSTDGIVFQDVKTFDTINDAGVLYMEVFCKYRYRRFVISAAGTSTNVKGILIKALSYPHFTEDKITLFDNFGKITNLFEYGAEAEKALWVGQEGMLSSVNKWESGLLLKSYTLDKINIDELITTSDEWNAKAINTTDVYLVFSWLNGIQRYYNTQLEGKGPDKDEGFPFAPINRQGRITKLLSYPSNFFCSVDGGENGLSSVLMFNQNGWHEIYRAPNIGERIFDMAFQPIYGDSPDKLWMQVGDEMVWLAMPSKTLNALHDKNALYTHESVLVSSWITAGMLDIEKLWQSMKIAADNLDDDCFVEADYRLDDDIEWKPLEKPFTISPSEKQEIEPNGSANGKRFQYRLRLQTRKINKTPHVNVVVIEAIGRVDIKYSYAFSFRNIKYKKDLNGEYEDLEPVELQDILDKWANKIEKLKLNSRYKIFDDKIVYLDASQTSVLNELQEGYIGQVTVNEL